MRTLFALGTSLLVLLLLAAPSSAAVDVEVTLKTSLRGTISPSGEIESCRFEGTAGTLLSFTVSGKGLDLSVTLIDPAEQTVVIGNAPGFKDSGSKVSLKKFALDRTGVWTLRITAVGTGTYTLKIKGKSAKKVGETVTVKAGEATTLAISAPKGSSVSLKAKAAGGSVAEPRLGAFDGLDLHAMGKFSTKAHSVKVDGVTGGDLDVEVKNLGGTDGDIAVKIAIKAPKAVSLKLDVTVERLGRGETALSRGVDAADGGTVMVEDETSPIAGAAVAVGAGALAEKTTISVASRSDVTPPDGQQSAGPAVAFGPAGLTFSVPVTITLPYDPSLLPAGTGDGDVRVVHVKGNGTPETLVPTTVDPRTRLLTVETTSFSTFMALAPKGPPNLESREYWMMFFDIEFDVDNDTNDSRIRRLFEGTGVVTLGPEGGESMATVTERETRFGHDGNDAGELGSESGTDTDTFEWNFLPGNEAVRVTTDDEDIDFALGVGGSVLIAGGDLATGEPLSSLQLLIEKPKTAPTLASLAGDFWFLEFEVEASGAPGPLGLSIGRGFGSVTLSANGSYVFRAKEHYCEFDGGGIACETESIEGGNSWRIAGAESGLFEGAVILSETDDDDGSTFENLFLPSADGNILLCLSEGSLVVAVRKSSGMSAARLAGEFRIRGLDIELNPYQGSFGTLGDLEVVTVGESATIKSNGTLEVVDAERVVTRDPGAPGGVLIETDGGAGSTKINVRPAGDFVVDPGREATVGAVTPDGIFAIAHDDPGGDSDAAGIVLVLKTAE